MLFAGFEVSDGRFTLLGIVVAGVLGNLVGSWIAYGIGYYGRVELLEKHGKWLHITPKHLAWADRWFERYGGPTVFFSRMLPVIRTFISLPAGVARMPFWKFTVLSIAGIIPWVLGSGSSARRSATAGTSGRRTCTTSTTRSSRDRRGIVYLLWRRRRTGEGGRAAGRPSLIRLLGRTPARRGGGARRDTGADRTAAGLELRPPRAGAGADGMALPGARPGAAQVVRGRAARGRRARAADRAAPRGRRLLRCSDRQPRHADASFAPAALAAYLFERPIEQRLGDAVPVAIALIAGSAAMALADGVPRSASATRRAARRARDRRRAGLRAGPGRVAQRSDPDGRTRCCASAAPTRT